MEFTLAKQRANEISPSQINCDGSVILSAFISSAGVMRGAVIVNPWDVKEVIFVVVVGYITIL